MTQNDAWWNWLIQWECFLIMTMMMFDDQWESGLLMTMIDESLDFLTTINNFDDDNFDVKVLLHIHLLLCSITSYVAKGTLLLYWWKTWKAD